MPAKTPTVLAKAAPNLWKFKLFLLLKLSWIFFCLHYFTLIVFIVLFKFYFFLLLFYVLLIGMDFFNSLFFVGVFDIVITDLLFISWTSNISFAYESCGNLFFFHVCSLYDLESSYYDIILLLPYLAFSERWPRMLSNSSSCLRISKFIISLLNSELIWLSKV